MTLNELKQKEIWFVWNYTPDKSGKLTKIPMAAYGTATGTDDKYSGTWVNYEMALKAKERFKTSGIGFKLPKGMFFLDGDHFDLSDPLVKLMLERFSSYAEISPSGNGIHILGTCDSSKFPLVYDEKRQRLIMSSEFYQKNSAKGIEFYVGDATNRFATFT